MFKRNLFITILTLLFNTSIAFLLWHIGEYHFWLYFIVSQSIGLSIMLGNLLIPYTKYTNSLTKIIMVSFVGLIVGLLIGVSSAQFIFGLKIAPPIFSALFFSIIAIVVAWLFFKKNEHKEALDLIKNKLNKATGSESKNLVWIKAADTKGIIYLINIKNIMYFQAQQKYTAVITEKKEYLINTTIKDLVQQLNKNTFWQIHRSTIINLNFIEKVSKNEQSKLIVFLAPANEKSIALSVSQAYVSLFKRQ